MKGTGSITYSGNSMNGVMDMTIVAHGTRVKNKISGDSQSNAATSTTVAQSPQERSKAEEIITEDIKDGGMAAKDEVKHSTVNEIRKGVRSVFKGIFN